MTSAEPITAARITELLRAADHDVTVDQITTERVGTGQMGASYRVSLTVHGDRGELPDTLVAKMADGPPEKRALAAGSYRTEVDFYRNVASTVAVRAPRCWASWTNDDCTEFILLLEDLAPRQQGDQIDGCSAEQATAAAVNLAGLHGPRWRDPTWATVGGLNVIDQASADMLGEVMAPMNEMFFAHFGDRLAPEDRAVFARVPEVAGSWLLGRSERHGPVHGDYRLDNLMFAPDSSDVVTVDWQTISLGLPTRDLAFLCSTGLDPDVRRTSEGSIVEAYHQALLTHGVDDYSLDACRDDYSYSMLQGPLIVVFGWAVADKTERGDIMFLAMAERVCSAIRDHDPFARL
ncbi:MAG: aminoglycoside phosphotransferase family protein [Aquihabitans sp.]